MRKPSSSALILDIGHATDSKKRQESGIEESITFVKSLSETLEKLQGKVEKQSAVISSLEKVVRDLEMHKEAAYSEMARTESALRTERERADRFEQLYNQALQHDQTHSDQVNRLMDTVRDAFDRAQTVAKA